MAAPAVGIFGKLAMMDYRIGESYWVDVTHINHPHSIFVRPVTFRQDLGYLQQGREQVDPSEVHDGKIVIYKSENLDLYVRGQIMKVIRGESDIKCDVKAIDYGCEDASVGIWRICNPKSDILVPPLATHCLLAHCMSLDPNGWTDDAIEAVKSYIGNERAKMVVVGKNSDQLTVELYNSCPNDISSMLTMTGYTAMGSTAEGAASLQFQPTDDGKIFRCKELKEGDILRVRLQSGKDMSHFYVAEIGDFNQHLKERKEFSNYCTYQKSVNIEDLASGTGVGFKSHFMSRYERAVVKEVINPNKVLIQQIDWGDIFEANIIHLKIVKPIIFGQHAALALFCSAPSVKEPEASAYLHPGVEFLIKIKKVGRNFETPHIVEISNFLQN